MPTQTPELKTSNRQTHGHATMKRALNALGSRAIDQRTSLGKALNAFRADLIADLGGASAVSTQQLTIIDAATKTRLLLNSLDVWLLKQPSLINKRKRSVLPVVLQRQALSDSLTKNMLALGLQRRARPVQTLSQLLSSTPPNVPD